MSGACDWRGWIQDPGYEWHAVILSGLRPPPDEHAYLVDDVGAARFLGLDTSMLGIVWQRLKMPRRARNSWSLWELALWARANDPLSPGAQVVSNSGNASGRAP